MGFEEVKQYVDAVKHSDKFKDVLAFTRLEDLKPGEDLYENIRYYLSIFHARRDCREWFQPDFDHFIRFLEHYLKDSPAEDVLDEAGYIDLTKTPHLLKQLRFVGNAGNFTDHHIMLTDGSKYVSKMPLIQRGNSGVRNHYCRYSALIASHVARSIGVEAAEIRIALAHNGLKIMSKNFLKDGEELITYLESADEVKISEQFNELEQALRLRKFAEEEIEVAKLEFLKQEFVAKMIGLRDQSPDNSPIIVGVDKSGNRYARLAPMFDFDYSFHIGEERPTLVARKCDNGQEDIASFIAQYKNYPGFEEFVKVSVQSINMSEIFRRIYQESGIKSFENYEDDEQMKKFIEYVNNNLRNC